jgi:hypothetical protein
MDDFIIYDDIAGMLKKNQRWRHAPTSSAYGRSVDSSST